MLVKLFGIFDLIIAIIFFLNNNLDKIGGWFPDRIVLYAGIYLLIKGIFFILTLDFASLLDIICAIIIIASIYTPVSLIISAIVIILLLQKGFFSLVS
jgi:hypothetical protein